jgi:hypothetical protein
MDDDIVYLKLTNGDELFATRISELNDKVFLDDVMIMETIQTDGNMKYLFMSRFTQYSDIHSMSLDKSCIVFIHEASAVVKNHYSISVQYAKQISDERFISGIADASKYLSFILKKDQKRTETKEESFEGVKDRILGTFESKTGTKH